VSEEAPGKPETAPTWHHYPAHKPSGIEWLGEIPEHWREKRLKFSAELVKKKATSSDSVRKYIGLEHVASWSGQLLTELNEFQVEGESLLFERDDVLFGKLRPYLAKCFVASEPGRCTSELLVLRRREYEPEFLKYLLLVPQIISLINGSTFGAKMPRAEWQFIGNLVLPLQAAEEQRAIADFLDRETAKIDALIAKKERLIDLLQEKRTALISHAMTKGLDRTVQMKGSGIEWLGEIPAHWEVVVLKRIARIRYGLGQPPPEDPEGKPLIRATNIKSGVIGEDEMIYVDPTQVPESRDATLKADEIIVVRSGAYTGDSAIIPQRYAGAISGYDLVVTVRKGNPRFFAWQLLSSEVRDLQFGFYSLRAAQPHLNAEELAQTLLVVPPDTEQRIIVDFLGRETAQIDALINKVREAIERLKEYRIALISAAVTGKIDVRREA